MEQFWRGAGVALGKYWQWVALTTLAITVVLGIGLTRSEFATGQDSYLNPDSQIALDNVEFQDNFGGETVIMLFTAQDDSLDVTDLVGPANVDEFQRLNDEMSQVDNVFSVITPLTSITYSDALIQNAGRNALLSAVSRDEAGSDVRSADAQVSLARLGEIPTENQFVGDPDWNDLLVYDNADNIRKSLASTFPDPQTAVGGVVLDGNLSLDDQSTATEELLDILATAEIEGFDMIVTGSPVYLKEINDYLQGGMLTLGAIALVVMAIVLGLMFRVRWRLLPLLAVIVGVVWTFSLLGWIGIDLSLVTISGLPILIGLGIDFAIQIHNRVEEEVVLDQADHPIAETLSNLAPPLLAATFAGVVSFLALRLSKVPMIRDFGVLLAIGVVVLVIVGIALPASILGIREWTSRTAERGPSVVERIVVKLGGLPTKTGLALLIASVFLFVGGVLVEGRTKIQSDPIKWIDQGSEVVADVEELEDETGFSTTLGVLVEANNVFDQDVIDLVWDFTLAAEERPEVVSSSSLVNTMGKILAVDGATFIAPTEEEIVAAAADAQANTPDIAQALFTEDLTSAQINLRLAPASLEERADLVEELEADLDARIDALDIEADSILLVELPDDQEPVRATPAGLATVGIGLLENLSANRAALTYFALCLAGLFLVLRFRQLQRALLALVPVFLAVGASSLIVGLLGIELSPLTTVSGPLVIATCTEFSVLILGRYLEERQSGLAPRAASDTAASRTGRAFFTSAMTTIGGFAVLIASPLPLLRDFGIIVTLNVAIALLAALILMPPMMVWVDSKGWLATERQVDPSRSVRLAAEMDGPAAGALAVSTVAVAGAAVGVYALADTSDDTSIAADYAPVPLPTTTTTTVPDEGGDEPAEPEGPAVDPSGYPSEVPSGVAAPILYGLLIDQGVEGNVANCAIDQMFTRAGGEQALIDLGLVSGSDEALTIVREGAADCGVPFEQVEGAIEAQFGPDVTLPAPPEDAASDDASDEPAEPEGPAVDPSGFPEEAPTEGIAGPFLYPLFVDNGVPGNVANCAISQILERAGGEEALLALDPLSGSDEVLELVREGSADCGADPEAVEAAIAQQFG